MAILIYFDLINIPVPSLDKHRRLQAYDSINHVMCKIYKKLREKKEEVDF